MTHLSDVQAAFSAQAADFSQPGLTVSNPVYTSWMLASLGLSPAWLVLDVAAGTGQLTQAMAPHVKQVVAVDAAPAMLHAGIKAIAASADGPARIVFVNGLAENLPVAAGVFDLVVCRFAIHHFEEPGSPVSDMVRACRAGGRIALIDLVAPNEKSLAESYNHFERLRDPSHARALPLAELERLLGDRGLSHTNSALINVPAEVEPWLWLARTDELRRGEIRDQLQAELLGQTTPGLRPFTREGVLYFQQSWAVTIATKPA